MNAEFSLHIEDGKGLSAAARNLPRGAGAALRQSFPHLEYPSFFAVGAGMPATYYAFTGFEDRRSGAENFIVAKFRSADLSIVERDNRRHRYGHINQICLSLTPADVATIHKMIATGLAECGLTVDPASEKRALARFAAGLDWSRSLHAYQEAVIDLRIARAASWRQIAAAA